ncbi:unnamed protein product [Arctogadus glacialis]
MEGSQSHLTDRLTIVRDPISLPSWPSLGNGKGPDGLYHENSSAIRYSLNSLKTSTQQATYKLSAARVSSLRPDAGGAEPTSEGAEPPVAVGD